jgi:hypothetical protein
MKIHDILVDGMLTAPPNPESWVKEGYGVEVDDIVFISAMNGQDSWIKQPTEYVNTTQKQHNEAYRQLKDKKVQLIEHYPEIPTK